MELLDKLSVLADAAKYDAACTSSGAKRGFEHGKIGCTSSGVMGLLSLAFPRTDGASR